MSKYLYFDFKCRECQTVFEDLVKPDVQLAPCPSCNGESIRLISKPTLDPKMGVDTDNPTMADKWARVRKQRAQIERKHYREHGTNRTPGADTSG